MSSTLLPHALLDLTFARLSARLQADGLAYHSLRRTAFDISRGHRYAHQSVLLESLASTEYVPLDGEGDRSLYARRQAPRQRASALTSVGLFPLMQERPLNELERRIAELKEAPVAAEAPDDTAPAYSDAELVSLYENLLSIPSRAQQQDVAAPEVQQSSDETILHRAVQALYALEDPEAIAADTKSQYMAAISKLREITEALEAARNGKDLVPVTVMSEEEWVSLVRICVEEQDGQAAENVIDLIKRSGTSVPEVALEITMALYADAGDVANAERFLTTFANPSPPERLRDLHVKAHIRSIEPRTFPTTALSILHDYETSALPAPQRSYTRCITALLSVHSTIAEAQAWDLFSHMRYVAHPTPDPYLYTVMIATCASRVLRPQPARALDLFTEMTEDKRIPPTVASYTAVIYACARSGEKLYVGEAFRLARQMLDGHRDAYGNCAFVPDRKTFCALLEGAKRIGDLVKVRWILAEIVAASARAARGDVKDAILVDEEIMTHVFHAYAAYKPPFVRATTVLVDQPDTPPAQNQSSESVAPVTLAHSPGVEEVPADGSVDASAARKETPSDQPPQLPVPSRTAQFTVLLPQSHAEVVGETGVLFSRILNDARSTEKTSLNTQEGAEDAVPHAFQHVQLTPRLLNAYLSVHYSHSRFDEGSDLYRTLFSQLGVEKNAWTYVEALERAARARQGQDRKQAVKFAGEVWEEWRPVEDAWRGRGENTARVDARLVERAHAAMLRILSLTGHLREGVQLVRTFFERYPPTAIKCANPKHALRSTRTVLQAPRPLVRLLSSTEVPDDTVPPLLSFTELEILHHRLVAVGDKRSISFLKYVCMSYSGALKRRKDAVLHAEPAKNASRTSPLVESV